MGKKRTLLFAAVVTSLIMPALVAPTVASAAPKHDDTSVELLTSGLRGASGGAIGPDGALYVTEAAVGEITRIDPRTGDKSTFATGLPPAVIGLGGAIDVAFVGHTAYALVTLVGPDVGGTQVSGIYRIVDENSNTVIADLGEFSSANPPTTPFDLPGGLQFALDTFRGGFLISDGHHNRVLAATRTGHITEFVQLENTVPTGLAVRGATVLVAEAGPIPHLPATGKVLSFGPKNRTGTEVASGFSLLVDVEFGRCGAIYALSQGDSPGDVAPASPALPDSGELLEANRDGTFSVVVDELNLPTSVDLVRDTALIVTMNGEVLKVSNVSAGGDGRACR